MRPILKPKLPDVAFGLPADVLLLQTLGEYCSICERPLPAENWVWDKRKPRSPLIRFLKLISNFRFPTDYSEPVDASKWRDVLIIDHNCFRAHDGIFPEEVKNDLLYPDEDRACFTLDSASPLTYELEETTRLLVTEDGRIADSSRFEAVIAKGHTPSARATVEFFQLNTRYYNPEEREFRIPEADYLALADRRVEQRTRVWSLAQRMADTIIRLRNPRDTEPNPVNIFLEQARLAIAAAGFWSTWATVLGMRLAYDREILSRLLLPRDADWTVGPGPHNTFPATRSDWLPAQRRG